MLYKHCSIDIEVIEVQIVITTGVSILIIFMLFILRKKNKMMSDYMLIITIILIAGLFISQLWVANGLTKINFIVEKALSFYILPAFVMYSMLLISSKNKMERGWWWFSSFAVAFTIFSLIDFTLLTEYDTEALSELYKDGSIEYHLFYRGSNFFALFTLFWLLRRLKEHRERIKDSYSSIDLINLTWLRSFTWVYIMNNVFILMVTTVFRFLNIGNLDELYLIVFISIVLSLFYLCFHGIHQYSLVEFDRMQTITESNPTSSDEKRRPKYESSTLTSEELELLYSKVTALLSVDQLYLESELKVQHIADKLGVTIHNISQTINSRSEKSFFDFVNEYRVAHLKKLLANLENKKYTIVRLGFESGFNSKASLNRVFKSHTGLSPKEYQVRHRGSA